MTFQLVEVEEAPIKQSPFKLVPVEEPWHEKALEKVGGAIKSGYEAVKEDLTRTPEEQREYYAHRKEVVGEQIGAAIDRLVKAKPSDMLPGIAPPGMKSLEEQAKQQEKDVALLKKYYPTLYGLYGASSAIGKFLPGGEFLYPESRKEFATLPKEEQTRQLKAEAAGWAVGIGGLRLGGMIGKEFLKSVSPKTLEFLTKPRTVEPLKKAIKTGAERVRGDLNYILRKYSVPERRVLVTSLDDMIRKNPDMTESEIMARWKNERWRKEAIARWYGNKTTEPLKESTGAIVTEPPPIRAETEGLPAGQGFEMDVTRRPPSEGLLPGTAEAKALPKGQGFKLVPVTKLRKAYTMPEAKGEPEIIYEIKAQSGKPFKTEKAAQTIKNFRKLTDYDIVSVDGGFVLRKPEISREVLFRKFEKPKATVTLEDMDRALAEQKTKERLTPKEAKPYEKEEGKGLRKVEKIKIYPAEGRSDVVGIKDFETPDTVSVKYPMLFGKRLPEHVENRLIEAGFKKEPRHDIWTAPRNGTTEEVADWAILEKSQKLKKAEPTPKAKEPWETPYEEWTETRLKEFGVEREDVVRWDTMTTRVFNREAHKSHIQKALSEGRSVPKEVLKDYPELAKKAEAKKPEIPEEATEIFNQIKNLHQENDNTKRLAAKRGYGWGSSIIHKRNAKIHTLEQKLGKLGYIYRERAFNKPPDLITKEEFQKELEADTKAKEPTKPEPLSGAQAAFIAKRVESLGSVEAVDKAYPGDSPVDEYARRLAQASFGEKIYEPEGEAKPKEKPTLKERAAQKETGAEPKIFGRAWHKEKWYPFKEFREIARGKNKGKVSITTPSGKKIVVERSAVERWPKEVEAEKPKAPEVEKPSVSDQMDRFESDLERFSAAIAPDGASYRIIDKEGKISVERIRDGIEDTIVGIRGNKFESIEQAQAWARQDAKRPVEKELTDEAMEQAKRQAEIDKRRLEAEKKEAEEKGRKKREAKKAEVVEAPPDKIVRIEVGKGLTHLQTLKAQKEKLLEEIDKAITEVPEEPIKAVYQPGYGPKAVEIGKQAPEAIKFILPDGQEFRIINTKEALEQFRTGVKKEFPLRVPKLGPYRSEKQRSLLHEKQTFQKLVDKRIGRKVEISNLDPKDIPRLLDDLRIDTEKHPNPNINYNEFVNWLLGENKDPKVTEAIFKAIKDEPARSMAIGGILKNQKGSLNIDFEALAAAKDLFKAKIPNEDISLLMQATSLPVWVARDRPGFNTIFQVQRRRDFNRNALRNTFLQDLTPALTLKGKKAKRRVGNVFWKGDELGSVLSEKGLEKLAPQERQAYEAGRDVLDYIWHEDLPQLMRDLGETESDIQKFRSSFGNLKGYFPRPRHGRYFGRIIAENGDVIRREHFDDILATMTRGKAGWRAPRIKKRLGKMAPEGAKVEMGENIRTPEQVFFEVSPGVTEELIDSALRKVGDEALKSTFRTALKKAVADVFKSRGFMAHALERKKVPGFDKSNWQDALIEYVSSYAGFKSKLLAAKELNEAWGSVDWSKIPRERAYADKYVKDVFANTERLDNTIDKARAILFYQYLGAVVKSATLQGTQNFITLIPRLTVETKWAGLKVTREMARAGGDILKAIYTQPRKGMTRIQTAQLKRITPEELRALTVLRNDGTISDMLTQELMGMTLGKFGSATRATSDALRFLFGAWEIYNRETAALTAFRIFTREQKLPFQEAVDKTRQIIDETHFLYGKSNLPPFARGGALGKIARAGYTFRSFAHNMLSLYKRLATKHGLRGNYGLIKALMALLAFGGIAGIPLYKTLEKVVTKMFGKNIRSEIADKAGDYAEYIFYGLPALLGIDLTGSISTELPTDLPEVMGVPYEWWKRGDQFVEDVRMPDVDIYRSIEDFPLTPQFVRYPMQGYRYMTRGQVSRSGKPIIADDFERVKLTEMEAIKKSLGYQPTKLSEGYRKYEARNDIEEYWNKKRDRLVSAWALIADDPDRGPESKDADKIMNKIVDFNTKKPAFVTKITAGTLRERRKAKPTKKEVRLREAVK